VTARSAAEFILSQPEVLTAEEVVRRAERRGIHTTRSAVYSARSRERWRQARVRKEALEALRRARRLRFRRRSRSSRRIAKA